KSLLRSQKLADRFKGGYLFLLRLTVSDYHRYIYAASGKQTKNYRIEGSLHTVDPLANDYLPIYKENTREYTLIHTKEFADVLQMEVGALLVGRIKNHKEKCLARRGEEKGYFEYGGSTIIVLTEPGAVNPREDLIANTKNDLETKVLQGQKIAEKA
nr:phosphatidylserine decarboxylase [Eubacterium sp.]